MGFPQIIVAYGIIIFGRQVYAKSVQLAVSISRLLAFHYNFRF